MDYPKIFCDIADISVIKKFNKKSIVKGFTTNPSLMRKAGAKNYKNYSKQILRICRKKPISFEILADNFLEMEKQALKINSWGKNIYVKIPVINSKGKSFKKNKYWIGALGLLTYEKIFFDEKLQKQYGFSVVFPYPIEMAFVE